MTTATSRPAARRRLLLAGIVILAALLRVWAAWQLPVDFDEPVYLRAGFDYAALLRTGQIAAVVDDPLNGEHPPLVKLVYAAGILSLGKEAGWSQALFLSRGISAAFGVLAVFLLALVDPLAGGLLAVQTLVIKYTSQAYLEALPLAAGLAALLALRRAAAARAWAGWPWLSAICLGLAAAGKLIYPLLFLPPLLAIAAGERHRPRRKAAAYAGLALLTFWLFDPALWHDPLGRLAGQLQFYGRYATGAAVQVSGYPWYQPLLWLSSNWPARWHPQVFLYYGLDAVIFWAAAAGLWHEWRERRWLVIWLATGVAVLLVWPTKWPQYTVALAPAFCLAAAASLRRARAWIAEQADYWPWVRELVPRPSRFFLIAPLAIVLALAAFYAGNKIQAELGQRGWSHLAAGTTPLPADFVHALASAADGRILLGTDGGAAIWTPGPAGAGGAWTVFTTANSGLADDHVLAVAAGGNGDAWFGTAAGLSRYRDGRWQTYGAAELGPAGDRILALALDPAGRPWIGTEAGAAHFDGEGWQPVPAGAPGLPRGPISAIAVSPGGDGDVIWFGAASGAAAYDTGRGAWLPLPAPPAGPDGITCLLVDAEGRAWAGTGSRGLWLWGPAGWTAYTSANANLPLNSVSAVFESAPGRYWIGTAFAIEQPGGLLSTFDGKDWQTYGPGQTGYSGGEVTAMARDAGGRLWLATRTRGIDIYQIPNR